MGGNVLVIDDDLPTQRVLGAVLRDAGHEVVLVKNGIDALAKLIGGTFQLVVLDLIMPYNGRLFVEELQHLGLHPGIRLLVLTAVHGGAEIARQLGADGYLAKPFEIAELVREVDRLMRRADLVGHTNER